MRSPALLMLGVTNYTVTRSQGGSWTTGNFIPAATVTVTISGRIQPLGGKEILRLEDGDRMKERCKLYSYDALFVLDDMLGHQADIISVDGIDFIVESVEKWDGYYKAILIRKNVSA